jgi:hypothetical protein
MLKFRFDLKHWNVSIGPEKWPIFASFLTLFPLKRPVWRKKNTSNMAATVRNVIDDVTCKSSIALRNNKYTFKTLNKVCDSAL